MTDVVTNTTIDHDTLWQHTASTLASLSSLRISEFRIKNISGAQVIVGGFGDVTQAKLRTTVHAIRAGPDRGSQEATTRRRSQSENPSSGPVWSRLKHRNILTLQGFYFDESSLKTAWIATLWQKNGNISTYVAAINADQRTRLKLALDTARGLEYLHGLSPPVCHGDIKPENTLIDDAGNAQLCDFGLSKVQEAVPSGLTTTKTTSCSLRYAAPELILDDKAPHTLASDGWAWGCLLLVIMTGILPYHKKQREIAVSDAIRNNVQPAELSTLHIVDFVQAVLARCWERRPESRPKMTWCYDVLLARSTSLLEGFVKLPFDQIRPCYTSEGYRWKGIRDPDSNKVYDCEVQSSFGDSAVYPSSYRDFKFHPDSRLVLHTKTSVMVDDLDASDNLLMRLEFPPRRFTKSKYPAENDIETLCLNHTGSILATGHTNGVVRIWDFPTDVLRREVKSHKQAICSLAFTKVNILVVSAQYPSSTIRAWDVETGSLLHTIRAKGAVGIIGSPRHSLAIVLRNRPRGISLFDVERGGCIEMVEPATTAVLTPNGNSIITSSRTKRGNLITWNLKPVLRREGPSTRNDCAHIIGREFPGLQSCIDSLSISSDGKLMASGSGSPGQLTDYSLVLWDRVTGRPLMKLWGPAFMHIKNLTFRPGSTVSQGVLVFATSRSVTSNEVNLGFLRYKLALESSEDQ